MTLIEFNELCPHLLEQFMRAGEIPNFARFYASSTVFTTDAGDGPPNLEPWIQWFTVHSGVPFSEHRVFSLGNGRNSPYKCMAECLSNAGIRVGVFGSMNLNYGRLNGYVIPDPWDKTGISHPQSLQEFYRIVATQVQESSKPDRLPLRDILRLASFLVSHGLSGETVAEVIRHLCSETLDRGLRWRRAAILDRIQYDVFRWLNARHQVEFATFFSNSTAHFQHYYWRNMSPDLFDERPSDSEHASLREAILYGYRKMDRLLGLFMRDDPDGLLVLCTALSQQPWTEATKVMFRPRSFAEFLRFAGVNPETVRVCPVMAEQFQVECEGEGAASAAEQALLDLAVDGKQLMAVYRTGNSVYTGCRMWHPGVEASAVQRKTDRVEKPFRELFYGIHGRRSGRHHPDGVLWFRNGHHRVEPTKVPLTAIAPTILAHFRVAKPGSMRGEPLLLEPSFSLHDAYSAAGR